MNGTKEEMSFDIMAEAVNIYLHVVRLSSRMTPQFFYNVNGVKRAFVSSVMER